MQIFYKLFGQSVSYYFFTGCCEDPGLCPGYDSTCDTDRYAIRCKCGAFGRKKRQTEDVEDADIDFSLDEVP